MRAKPAHLRLFLYTRVDPLAGPASVVPSSRWLPPPAAEASSPSRHSAKPARGTTPLSASWESGESGPRARGGSRREAGDLFHSAKAITARPFPPAQPRNPASSAQETPAPLPHSQPVSRLYPSTPRATPPCLRQPRPPPPASAAHLRLRRSRSAREHQVHRLRLRHSALRPRRAPTFRRLPPSARVASAAVAVSGCSCPPPLLPAHRPLATRSALLQPLPIAPPVALSVLQPPRPAGSAAPMPSRSPAHPVVKSRPPHCAPSLGT
ncbi:unnamed protein product [Closterium sp. NIES-54]